MGRLIFDTSVLVHAERLGLPIAELGDTDEIPGIAGVTLAELYVGALRASSHHRTQREVFIEHVRAATALEVYDERVARAHAELIAHVRAAGEQRGAHDLIIAATARVTSRAVVTLDRRGFEGLPGVAVLEAGQAG